MSAFQNLRQNPFDSNYSDRVMDEEIHTIAEFDFLPGVYGIILQDRPTPSTIVIVENNTAQTPFTEVLSVPAANQYRVSYTRGVIQFNAANDGDIVAVNYSGRGTNVTLELLEQIVSELASTFSEINATNSTGILFNASGGTDIALFGAGGGSGATFYGGINIDGSATITGGVAITTTDATAPGIRKSDDTNTGIDWSAADQLDLVTGGSPRFRIESTGQIKAVYESTIGTDYNITLHNGYFCRAWIFFNGTGTPSIYACGNFSSVTDSGTAGGYTYTFVTTMPDANYAVVGMADFVGGSTSKINLSGLPTASSFSTRNRNASGSDEDFNYGSVAVFR